MPYHRQESSSKGDQSSIEPWVIRPESDEITIRSAQGNAMKVLNSCS
jgi:hypothetical protein